jgi:hypothetical protein
MARTKGAQDPVAQHLSDVVSISRQFQRSIRIDSDSGVDGALSGYVCQGAARTLLETMGRQVQDSRQRAFTWTGPYGGGKSSLALMLCSLVGPNENLRARAREILDLPAESPVHAAFQASGSGWLVIPVVGKRARASDEIARRLSEVRRRRGPQRDIVSELVAAADSHDQGVLLVIDELGKYLEFATQAGEDIYFYQQLAEAAARAQGKLIVVGVLHQPFEAYATRLGRETRDEWAKVQGRFVDIPLVAATDEVVELVARAIQVQTEVDARPAGDFAWLVAAAIRARRPGTPETIGAGIARCWPLHPVVAALLGPVSRRRFSQNERSDFGFLASREPLGFVEFLREAPVDWKSMYGPARFWDYLAANLEPAILASTDGHRWSVAAEAIERAESKGGLIHVELAKCVALIELFRGGSGLVPEIDVLAVCVQGAGREQVEGSLRDLVSWKVLIDRKHLSAYGIFAGSDFDIEAAVTQARTEISSLDVGRLSALSHLQPILAKRLYHETGTMRWFTRHLVDLDGAEALISSFKPAPASVGAFVLCLPRLGAEEQAQDRIVALSKLPNAERLVLGTPKNATRIADLALELVSCESVLRDKSELEGDAVARKELVGRISAIRARLEDELADAFSSCIWYWRGRQQELDSGRSIISSIASTIAARIFKTTPVIHSELLNREEPSANSNRARKDLMYRMVSRHSEPELGYEGYPADAGLYHSVLRAAGLHRELQEGLWGFGEPTGVRSANMRALWQASWEMVAREQLVTKLADLYAMWAAPPFGVRSGIMPVIAMALFLAHRGSLALYIDGTFTPELSEAQIDEWLSDPARIAFKHVSASTNQVEYVEAVARSVPKLTSREPLEVARALVRLVLALPGWTKRTATVSQQAQDVRALLMRANDPHKLLFADLPTLVSGETPQLVEEQLIRVLDELRHAYPKLIFQVQNTLFQALDNSPEDLDRLRARAQVVKGIAGDFRLEAFVSRLENFDGSIAAFEGLIGLGCNKPPLQWVDRDIDLVLLQLATWAQDFRRAEALAPLRGRESTRRGIGVVFAASEGKDATGTVDIDDSDQPRVSQLAGKLLDALDKERHEVALAVLAEVGAALLMKKIKEVAA